VVDVAGVTARAVQAGGPQPIDGLGRHGLEQEGGSVRDHPVEVGGRPCVLGLLQCWNLVEPGPDLVQLAPLLGRVRQQGKDDRADPVDGFVGRRDQVEPVGRTPVGVAPGRLVRWEQGIGAGGEPQDQRAECVPVDRRRGRSPLRLLGRQETGCARGLPQLAETGGELQVHQGETAAVAEQDVRGREVVQHDAEAVHDPQQIDQVENGRLQRGPGQAGRGATGLRGEPLAQGRAGDAFLREEQVAALLEQRERLRCDAQRSKAAQHVGLVAQGVSNVPPVAGRDVRPGLLDDDRAVGRSIDGLEDAALVGVPDRAAYLETVGEEYGLGARWRRRPLVLERRWRPRRWSEPSVPAILDEPAVRCRQHVEVLAVVAQHALAGHAAVAEVHEAAGAVGPVGQDRRAGQARGGLVQFGREPAELLVVDGIDRDELAGAAPREPAAGELAYTVERAGELERARVGGQHVDHTLEHLNRRRDRRRDVQLPPLQARLVPHRPHPAPHIVGGDVPLLVACVV
jgi:hypothetical protein